MRILWWSIAATTVFAGVLAAQPEVNAFLDDTRVQNIQLTVDPNDWASLQEHYKDNAYYKATFTWNGITQQVGIRSHGGISRSPLKPNVDVNFSKYTKGQTFLGLRFLVLKANNVDPSNLHEWISFQLFRRMGLPAPREAPAQVFVNGNLLGLFFVIEHEEEQYVYRILGEETGYLYAWQSVYPPYNFQDLGPDPNQYAPYLELKSAQTEPDLQTFANFVAAINRPVDDTYVSGISRYIDPKLFLTHVAVENVLSERDGIAGGIQGLNNFYLYQFQGTTLYQLLTWDKDMTFSVPEEDILNGVATGANINVLAQKLYSIPEYRNVYLGALSKAAQLFGGAGGWADQLVDREYALIHDAATNDPNKQCTVAGVPTPCGPTDFEFGIEWMHHVISIRSDLVLSQVASQGYQPMNSSPTAEKAVIAAPGGAEQLVPGALASVYGKNYPGAFQSTSDLLPRVLGNTYVTVDGVRAPLLATSVNQINLQVPWDVPVGKTVSVVVDANGNLSNTLDVAVVPASPAVFAIVHSNGRMVTSAEPLTPGESLLVYATGLGMVNAPLDDGVPAPPGSAIPTVQTPTVSIGGLPAPVLFSGLAPGFVGLYQLNLTAPRELPAGQSAVVTVTLGSESASLDIPVQ